MAWMVDRGEVFMTKVRKATVGDYSGIKNVASKAWYDTYTNIYTASTVTAFLNASYSKEMIESALMILISMLLKRMERLLALLISLKVLSYIYHPTTYCQKLSEMVMVKPCCIKV